ncbi:response regulator [Candidatus Peregrinibacteria bacterium]|nr:response regulator [Candidatus Peregrinibacteria bacterium]
MEKISTSSKERAILMVDGDKELIRDITDLLEKEEIQQKLGLRFSFAKDAHEALKKIAEMKFDLIILDPVLPVISGYYLIDVIRKTGGPIVFYTKLKNPEDLAKMASYDIENIFLKDLTKPADLITMIGSDLNLKANLDKLVMDLQAQIKVMSATESGGELKLLQCPRCHMILGRDSHFCNNCGQKIASRTKKIQLQPAASVASVKTK